jgi:hypothetical protein
MSLATIIRSEFAYPGVGILAGDSIQYLSIATAHGVIMVFYMIMPLIFGAFGNFLLPTQLGVHDVAFPRLNSAAFWFLPGGLIMLMQLVCVDRRYQNMNCFNIRELQGILKRKFFADLVNSADHREVLSSSMIGLRFKANNNFNLDHDVLSFFKLGTNNLNRSRSSEYSSSYAHKLSFNGSTSAFANNYLPYSSGLFSATNTFLMSTQLVILSPLVSLKTLFSNFNFTNLFTALKSNIFFSTSQTNTAVYYGEIQNLESSSNLSFQANNGTNNFSKGIDFFSEKENLSRFSRFANSTVSYDYKCGNYLGS